MSAPSRAELAALQEAVDKLRATLARNFDKVREAARQTLASIDFSAASEALRRYRAAQVSEDPVQRALWAGLDGLPIAYWPMYLQHLADAETVHERRAALDDANQRLHDERATTWARWQGWADQIWEGRPHLSNKAVARLLKSQHQIPDRVGTIAKRIKNRARL